MTAARVADWRKDFGIAERRPPQFLSSVDQLDQPGGAVPQPLRCAALSSRSVSTAYSASSELTLMKDFSR